jgi:hypothetical protein
MQQLTTTWVDVPTIYYNSQCFKKLFELWKIISDLPDDSLDVTFNFSKCRFLAHNGVAFLGGLAHCIEVRGGIYNFHWDSLAPKIKMNLAQNGFLKEFGHRETPWDGNSIPYRRDMMTNDDIIKGYLREKWLGKNWVILTKSLESAIVSRVYELYNNAFEHSHSKIGVFSCGQHYPQKKRLHLTIVDFGQGIPVTVCSLQSNQALSTIDAMKWAFALGNSTVQSNISRGLGLNLLQDFLTKNQGGLKIFSNHGYVYLKEGRMEYEVQETNFSGTLFNLELQCDESLYDLEPDLPPGAPWF